MLHLRSALLARAANTKGSVSPPAASRKRHPNPEQIMKDVGVFARARWNDGQNQILSFTDIDRSV